MTARNSWRLGYHLMPQTGWMNDPNGFIEYAGKYHMFFQHWPDEPVWGPMHWGHAISDDLVRWEYLPVALYPSEEYDFSNVVEGYGCFSGSAAVDAGGDLTLMYTGHVDDRDPMQSQCVAKSTDGVTFAKSPRNPVIPAPPEDCGPDFRDPKIFTDSGRTFVIIGGSLDGLGRALLYEAVSASLEEWSYRGVAASAEPGEGTMWECPDMFALDGSHVLLYSPMQGALNVKPVALVGEFDAVSGRFTARTSQVLDGGIDFYAPQSMEDSGGRRIMTAWMQQWHQEPVTAEDGWSGAQTIPRRLRVKGGRLLQEPVAELATLRLAPLEFSDLGALVRLPVLADISLRAQVKSGRGFRIGLFCAADRSEQTVYTVDMFRRRVTCDRALSGAGEATSSHVVIVDDGDGSTEVDLRFLTDTCSIELFVNAGSSTLTNRVYPRADSTGFFVEPIGGSEVEILEISGWELERVNTPGA